MTYNLRRDATGFEPAASCTPMQTRYRAALRPMKQISGGQSKAKGELTVKGFR